MINSIVLDEDENLIIEELEKIIYERTGKEMYLMDEWDAWDINGGMIDAGMEYEDVLAEDIHDKVDALIQFASQYGIGLEYDEAEETLFVIEEEVES